MPVIFTLAGSLKLQVIFQLLSVILKRQKKTLIFGRGLYWRSAIFIYHRARAIAELERAIKLGDENVPVILALRHLLAQCREVNKELILAVEQWEKIYAVNPKYKDAIITADILWTYSFPLIVKNPLDTDSSYIATHICIINTEKRKTK